MKKKCQTGNPDENDVSIHSPRERERVNDDDDDDDNNNNTFIPLKQWVFFT